MESFLKGKRGRDARPKLLEGDQDIDGESTEVKLAILASTHPLVDADVLLEALISSEGSVEKATCVLSETSDYGRPRKKLATSGYQSSLSLFRIQNGQTSPKKTLTRKGRTLHLYSPEDVAEHTPCSIIHNFLLANEADVLLRELLNEAPTFHTDVFKLFDKTVKSPHTSAFYVDNFAEAEQQKAEYLYNGASVSDVRKTTPEMLKVSVKVRHAVNDEIKKRINSYYPGRRKLKYQSPKEWIPNTAFVNCYDGGAESVGYHSDQLTYLGPRAVIGSLSLGVAREFRVRKVVARELPPELGNKDAQKLSEERADVEGQISIHLPHNSLLVMHAEMQEEWKHSIAHAQTVEPHPIAKNRRLNITYRCYRESFHPRCTPKCKCGVQTVLRCVQKKQDNRGRYMWMCHAGYSPGQEGCSFFQWAEFDDDGEPLWATTQPSGGTNQP